MKLRSRLALAGTASLLPVIIGLVVADSVGQRRAAEQVLTSLLVAYVPSRREACERSPENLDAALFRERPFAGPPGPHARPGGPPMFAPGTLPLPPPMSPPPMSGSGWPPPPRAFAYDEQFQSRNASAPRLSAALMDTAAEGGIAVAPFSWRNADVEVLVRMPWGTGPCAYVLARGAPLRFGGLLPQTKIWLLPITILFGAVLVAIGPVIRRIRALTEAVRQSASTSYQTDIIVSGNDEIGELAQAFDAAVRQIRLQIAERDRREKVLRDFLANTTHDVMIPLTVLQGHLATLRDSAPVADATGRSTVSLAMDEAHYIASLVHNLGAVARLEVDDSGAQRSRVDVAALAARVVGRHLPIARERRVSLDSVISAPHLYTSADLTLLEQAVSNLTYNAVRYNNPGGHVAVIVESESSDRFVLRVVDDGPGIPEPDLVKLAARGARGNEARTRVPDGQGIGIDIVRRAAEIHGFDLSFQRSEYGGLEVRLRGTLLS